MRLRLLWRGTHDQHWTKTSFVQKKLFYVFQSILVCHDLHLTTKSSVQNMNAVLQCLTFVRLVDRKKKQNLQKSVRAPIHSWWINSHKHFCAVLFCCLSMHSHIVYNTNERWTMRMQMDAFSLILAGGLDSFQLSERRTGAWSVP